jgi:hypothetical protein
MGDRLLAVKYYPRYIIGMYIGSNYLLGECERLRESLP